MANKPNLPYAIGNRLATTLDGSITNSATTVNVVDASGAKAAGGYGIIDEENEATREIVYVESVSSNVLTIATNGRGLCGTVAVAHASGVSFKDIIVDDMINGLVDQFKVGHDDDGGHTAASIDSLALDATTASGWISANETWTYASAITFTITGDKTAKYSVGMKLKLTQTTAKYFIVTKVEYSDPSTTVTVYGGTDYTLANAAITSPYYSTQKSPHGFPMSPTKWTTTTTDTSSRSQSSPVGGTWYNLGSLSIAIPIGAWKVDYFVVATSSYTTKTDSSTTVTLSTANNTAGAAETMDYRGSRAASASGWEYNSFHKEFVLNLESAATYYLNTKTDDASDNLINANNLIPARIRAVCAYL